MTDNYNFGDDDLSWLDATLTSVPAPVPKQCKAAQGTESLHLQWHYPEQYRERHSQILLAWWAANPQARKQRSEAYRGRRLSDTHLQRIRANAQKRKGRPLNRTRPGRPWTEQERFAQSIFQQLLHLAGLRKSSLGRKMSPEVCERNRQSKCKPIQTPYGQFASKQAAVQGLIQAGVVNAGGKLTKWLSTDSANYYYIAKDTE